MSALKRAWEQQHGPGGVVGLAPSAAAAQVLGDELGIPAENTARWWQLHLHQRQDFAKDQLVILDEASLAGTGSLDRITGLAEQAGAKVLLVGDWSQLQAVDAGGTFAMLVHDRDDAPELTDMHRFAAAWEKTNSLNLRHGRAEAIDILLDHDQLLHRCTCRVSIKQLSATLGVRTGLTHERFRDDLASHVLEHRALRTSTGQLLSLENTPDQRQDGLPRV